MSVGAAVCGLCVCPPHQGSLPRPVSPLGPCLGLPPSPMPPGAPGAISPSTEQTEPCPPLCEPRWGSPGLPLQCTGSSLLQGLAAVLPNPPPVLPSTPDSRRRGLAHVPPRPHVRPLLLLPRLARDPCSSLLCRHLGRRCGDRAVRAPACRPRSDGRLVGVAHTGLGGSFRNEMSRSHISSWSLRSEGPRRSAPGSEMAGSGV